MSKILNNVLNLIDEKKYDKEDTTKGKKYMLVCDCTSDNLKVINCSDYDEIILKVICNECGNNSIIKIQDEKFYLEEITDE
jgi:predicted SprT family Zn-dependent metalloprotease